MGDYIKKVNEKDLQKKSYNKDQNDRSTNLYKNINDLLTQTNSYDFYKKFQSIMLDYFKPSYEDLALISQDMNVVGNINEERIKRYRVLNHIFNLLDCSKYLPESFFNCIAFDDDTPCKDELLLFWRLTTRKIELKQILGFPLCVYSNRTYKSLLQNDKRYYMYFLKNPTKSTTSFYTEINRNENLYSEIFQKILIFYHLYQNGFVSQNYIFEEIENKNVIKMTFKVLDLLFVVPIRNIILLSPKTHLICIKNIKPYEYFNSLDQTEISKLSKMDIESFPEFLILNFPQFFQKNIYNTRNLSVIAEVSQTTQHTQVGRLYLIQKNDSKNIVYCIILNKNTTHATLLYLFDSTIPNTLSLSTQTFSIQDLNNFIFYTPNFIFNDNITNYFIGLKN